LIQERGVRVALFLNSGCFSSSISRLTHGIKGVDLIEGVARACIHHLLESARAGKPKMNSLKSRNG
jgi:hypothetical protein